MITLTAINDVSIIPVPLPLITDTVEADYSDNFIRYTSRGVEYTMEGVDYVDVLAKNGYWEYDLINTGIFWRDSERYTKPSGALLRHYVIAYAHLHDIYKDGEFYREANKL